MRPAENLGGDAIRVSREGRPSRLCAYAARNALTPRWPSDDELVIEDRARLTYALPNVWSAVMTLLVIEDEAKTGAYLKKGLEESGFSVGVATNGVVGLHLALKDEYALVILDLMIPRIDGWTVLSRLRESKDMPVLILTAI